MKSFNGKLSIKPDKALEVKVTGLHTVLKLHLKADGHKFNRHLLVNNKRNEL